MANRKETPPPATTPEAREQQLQVLAMDLIERQLRDGTVSSQVLAYVARSASPRERLERKRLEQENELLRAKVEQMEAAAASESSYLEVLAALRIYSGQESHDFDA